MSLLNTDSFAANIMPPQWQFGGLDYTRLQLRSADPSDLEQINDLISRAIQSWNLPDRVKRIGLPIYLYRSSDLEFLQLVLAEDMDGNLVGVAAWEPAPERDAPRGRSALMLHGIYVDPDLHRCGIGTRLLDAAVQAAARDYFDGLVVKAQADAIPFFEAQGLQLLMVEQERSDYPHRYWYPTRRT